MRINCFIFGLLLMYTPFGIAQEKEVTKIIFPYTTSIQSKSFSVPDIVFGKIPSLVITNNYLIILRTYTEPLFHVFDLPDCKYIGGFGNLGKGPNDFESPESRAGLKTSNGFKVFDQHKGFMYIDLSNYRENKTYGIKTLKVPGELYILNDAIQLDDSIIIGLPEDWKTDSLNVRYNSNIGTITYFSDYPALFPKKYKDHFWSAFWRHSIPKPDGTKFASFFENYKMLRIYDASGNVLKERVMILQDIFDGKIFKRNIYVYYTAIKASNNYIYVLCMNARSQELNSSFPSIEIWDWNGSPVASLTLDHHIKSFDITPDGKGIYAMDREVSDKLFYYDLEAAF